LVLRWFSPQWRLFVPQEWADDPVRRRKTKIPDEVGHREKWRLALDTIDELAGWGLVPPAVVADAGYGQNADFRADEAAPFGIKVLIVEPGSFRTNLSGKGAAYFSEENPAY